MKCRVIRKMKGIIVFTLLIITQVLGDCITCNKCVANKSPKKDGRYVLFPDHYNNCDVGAEFTSFNIKVQSGFNGCGYADDINALYQQCADECQACHKIDSKCESITDHPSSTIRCPLQPCIQRGQSIKFGTKCCDGLSKLDFKCIDPKQDCTPCEHPIEANKPCCDTSGINRGGVWKCANSFGSVCKAHRECPVNHCCDRGSCRSRESYRKAAQEPIC